MKKKYYRVGAGLSLVGVEICKYRWGQVSDWLNNYCYKNGIPYKMQENEQKHLCYCFELRAFEAYKKYLGEKDE